MKKAEFMDFKDLKEFWDFTDPSDTLYHVCGGGPFLSASGFKHWSPDYDKITNSFLEIRDVYNECIEKMNYIIMDKFNISYVIDFECCLNINYIFKLQAALKFDDEFRNELLKKYIFYYLSTKYSFDIEHNNMKEHNISALRIFKEEYLDTKEYLAKYNIPITLDIDEMIKSNICDVREKTLQEKQKQKGK